MFDNEILSPNEKLKSIRNLIGATQSEVSNGICTKYLISQIENNKKKLNYKLALGLAKNLNEIVKIKKIDILKITADKLTEDENSQANYLFSNSIIHQLKKIEEIDALEEKLSEGENLIKKYNIEDNMKIDMYTLAANIYYFKEKYNKSDEMCRYGLKVCLTSGNIIGEAHFYISESRNNVVRKNYIIAIEQLDYALKLNTNIGDNEILQRVYFNKALIYNETSKYDKSIKYLNKLTNEFGLENSKLLDIRMLHANCLLDSNKLEEAENKYIEILEPAGKLYDKSLLAMSYRNLSEVYLKQKKYKDSKISIDKCLEYNNSIQYLASNLYFASQVYKAMNEDSEKYLLRALNVSEKNHADYTDVTKKIINDLLIIYMKREDEENITLLLEKEKKLNVSYNLIYAKLIKYYKCRNEEKSNYFNEKLIKNIE